VGRVKQFATQRIAFTFSFSSLFSFPFDLKFNLNSKVVVDLLFSIKHIV
jgi:hypothetical protein